MRIAIRVDDDVTYLEIHGRLVAGVGATFANTENGDVLKLRQTTDEGDHRLSDDVEELVRSGRVQLVLDLAAVEYIDSAGLGEIVRAYRVVRAAGGTLRIANMASHISRVLPPWLR